jgi:hypothetical protein
MERCRTCERLRRQGMWSMRSWCVRPRVGRSSLRKGLWGSSCLAITVINSQTGPPPPASSRSISDTTFLSSRRQCGFSIRTIELSGRHDIRKLAVCVPDLQYLDVGRRLGSDCDCDCETAHSHQYGRVGGADEYDARVDSDAWCKVLSAAAMGTAAAASTAASTNTSSRSTTDSFSLSFAPCSDPFRTRAAYPPPRFPIRRRSNPKHIHYP